MAYNNNIIYILYINLIFYKLMKKIISSTIKHLWARDCKGIKFNNVH